MHDAIGALRGGIQGVSPAVRPWLALALLAALTLIPSGRTQNSSGSNGGQSSMHQGLPMGRQGLSTNVDDIDPVMTERRMRALNIERQKLMVSDTNKLLKLAKELNDEVATSNTGAFTSDQLRKIAEIEKLARSVRERMTTGIGDAQSMLPSSSIVYPAR